jgi:hypothetical protein
MTSLLLCSLLLFLLCFLLHTHTHTTHTHHTHTHFENKKDYFLSNQINRKGGSVVKNLGPHPSAVCTAFSGPLCCTLQRRRGEQLGKILAVKPTTSMSDKACASCLASFCSHLVLYARRHHLCLHESIAHLPVQVSRSHYSPCHSP